MKSQQIKFFVILLLLLGTLPFNQINAQEGILWSRIPSIDQLTLKKDGDKLISSSDVVNDLIQRYAITDIYQALPASKNSILLDVYQIECTCNEHELLQEIARISSIFIEPEIGPHYETLYTPNDYSDVFAYDYGLELINAPGAWEVTKGDSTVLISISDAGYDLNHTEFQGKGLSISENITYSNIAHGTAVALTAAGATDNEFGKSSIGYNSSLDLRGMSYNELLAASYAGTNVVNASWASGCYYSSYAQMTIDEIHQNGTVIVASAGNGSTCGDPNIMVYPASYEHVISVTSVGPANNHERTIGDPSSTHQHNLMVDIAAPGYDLPVAINNNGFVTANGTSFAAPLVSGTVALMLAVNPCLTSDQIEFLLKMSADTIINSVNPQYAGRMGAGRLDAAKAVEMAKNFSTFQASTSIETYCQFNSQVITINELEGSAPYSIQWSNGDLGMICLTGPADTYTLDVIDSLGCRYHKEFLIEELIPLSVEATVTPISCFGEKNGSIELNVTGGYPTYAINWSNGQEMSTIEGLEAGSYEVQITDSKGCYYTDIIEIIEPEQILVQLEITNPTEFFNGSVDVTANGGTGNLSYLWQTGATTEDLYDLTAGIYQVTISDENGCLNSKLAILQEVSVAGVNEKSNLDLRVFPNPAVDEFTVSSDNESINQIDIINMQGQLIRSISVNQTQELISTEGIASGTYQLIITLNSGNEQKSSLIVKK